MDDRLRQAIYALHAWITQADDRMDENLKQAIDTLRASITAADDDGNINALYASIRVNPKLLESIDQIPFIETPLHIAAAAGRTHFAIEVLRLKPSFGRKLNLDGLSPLHLALQNGHAETVRRLIKFDCQLIRVQGKESITPLHVVAGRDEYSDLLAEFLCACPESIEDLTVRGETAVHIAVANGGSKAFEILLGWLHWTDKEDVLNWKNDEGNTVLHIAASNNQPQMVKKLIKKVNKNEKNLKKFTAFDIGERNGVVGVWNILNNAGAASGSSVRDAISPATFLKSQVSKWERCITRPLYCMEKKSKNSAEILNMLLVVAVLIATATYQSILSPPGGVWQAEINTTCINTTTTTIRDGTTQQSNRVGDAVWPKREFNNFMILNSLAFATSVGVIALILKSIPCGFLLEPSLLLLMIGYMYVMTNMFHRGTKAIIPAGFYIVYLLTLISFYPRLVTFGVQLRGILSRRLPCKNAGQLRQQRQQRLELRRRVAGW